MIITQLFRTWRSEGRLRETCLELIIVTRDAVSQFMGRVGNTADGWPAALMTQAMNGNVGCTNGSNFVKM